MEPTQIKEVQRFRSEDDSIHSTHPVNQISDISKSSGHFSQPGNVNQAMPPGHDGQSNLTCPCYPSNQYQNPTNMWHHILELAMCVEYLAT